jgi:hypothetical protein
MFMLLALLLGGLVARCCNYHCDCQMTLGEGGLLTAAALWVQRSTVPHFTCACLFLRCLLVGLGALLSITRRGARQRIGNQSRGQQPGWQGPATGPISAAATVCVCIVFVLCCCVAVGRGKRTACEGGSQARPELRKILLEKPRRRRSGQRLQGGAAKAKGEARKGRRLRAVSVSVDNKD